jgi:lysophospholipase L1-like esterase
MRLAVVIAAIGLVAASGRVDAQALGTLNSFGDSYTQSYWRSVPNWVTQLRSQKAVAVRVNYARAGATAVGSGGGRQTFDGQLDEWERAGRPQARRTIVYFGYNDIARRYDLGRSARALAAGVDRLVRGGANGAGRRLILTQVHDWGRNPTGAKGAHARTATWNRQVRSIAAARGLRVVNIHATVNAVFQAPRRYGITNTSTPSRTNPAHLFFDGGHFGQRGQRVIANAMRAALAR